MLVSHWGFTAIAMCSIQFYLGSAFNNALYHKAAFQIPGYGYRFWFIPNEQAIGNGGK